MDTAPQTEAPRQRLDLVDVLRGLALAAMVVFHGAWDLSNANLIETDISHHAGWQWFARAIAASFLTLSGISLVLAHGHGFRARPFWQRWLLLAGAAALVTAGTWVMFPDGFVFFGILHHIALASLVALAFLRVPPVVTLLAGILAIALPALFRSTAFDPAVLIWSGLAVRVPDSVDFVPFFPWIGFVLAGVALGRVGESWLVANGWQAKNRMAKLTALTGRHSLAFYLIHQPVLLGAIWLWQSLPLPLAATSAAPLASAAMQRFDADCRVSCAAQGAATAFCATACACTGAAAAKEPALVAAIAQDRLDARQSQRLIELSQICARPAEPTKP